MRYVGTWESAMSVSSAAVRDENMVSKCFLAIRFVAAHLSEMIYKYRTSSDTCIVSK